MTVELLPLVSTIVAPWPAAIVAPWPATMAGELLPLASAFCLTIVLLPGKTIAQTNDRTPTTNVSTATYALMHPSFCGNDNLRHCAFVGIKRNMRVAT